MKDEFVCLIDKEEMWARILMQVLEDHDIPCTSLPVFGAGMVMKSGVQERLTIYVPAEKLQEASELAEALFSAEIILEDQEDFDSEEWEEENEDY
ncbi:MAG: hypothetical protein E7324_08190 [Clostridiales bacterium]|nr:hypothetical protein [Clostridiales bacterium]